MTDETARAWEDGAAPSEDRAEAVRPSPVDAGAEEATDGGIAPGGERAEGAEDGADATGGASIVRVEDGVEFAAGAITEEQFETLVNDLFPLRISLPLRVLREENILWRRLTRLRSPAELLSHPVLAPPLFGLAIGSLRFIPWVYDTLTVWEWLLAVVLMFACFESVLHFRAAGRLQALYDARVLHELRLGAMRPYDLLAGAVLPYQLGAQLGLIGLMAPIPFVNQDAGVRITIALFLLLWTWGAVSRPSVNACDLADYLGPHRAWQSVRVALGVVLSIAVTMGTIVLLIVAALYVMYWLGARQGQQHLFLLALLLAIIVHGRLAHRLTLWRTRRFYRRHGSLERFLDAYLERRA